MTRRLRIELDIPDHVYQGLDDPQEIARDALWDGWPLELIETSLLTAEWVKTFDELRQEFRDRYDAMAEVAPKMEPVRRGPGQTPCGFDGHP